MQEFSTRRRRAGKPFVEIDMLRAAHAMAADAVLVTNDTRHGKIESLVMATG
jgi:predicted nucleic acid-binding protein